MIDRSGIEITALAVSVWRPLAGRSIYFYKFAVSLSFIQPVKNRMLGELLLQASFFFKASYYLSAYTHLFHLEPKCCILSSRLYEIAVIIIKLQILSWNAVPCLDRCHPWKDDSVNKCTNGMLKSRPVKLRASKYLLFGFSTFSKMPFTVLTLPGRGGGVGATPLTVFPGLLRTIDRDLTFGIADPWFKPDLLAPVAFSGQVRSLTYGVIRKPLHG